MGQFVKGLGALFNGPDTSAQEGEIKRARQSEQIALDRQRQEVQAQAATDDQQLGRVARAPRGRRLLMAATGEGGLSSKLGS